MSTQQENEIPIKTDSLAETSIKQLPLASTPPSKTDIILKMIEERTKLEQYREELLIGKRRPSVLMKAIFYVTQIIISIDKIILDALKDNIQINAERIDISTEINELIKISRVEDCNNTKSQL
jgi:hypothetical protein